MDSENLEDNKLKNAVDENANVAKVSKSKHFVIVMVLGVISYAIFTIVRNVFQIGLIDADLLYSRLIIGIFLSVIFAYLVFKSTRKYSLTLIGLVGIIGMALLSQILMMYLSIIGSGLSIIAFGLFYGLFSFVITKKSSYFLIGVIIIIPISIIHFSMLVFTGNQYLENQVSSVLERVDETVGDEKLIATYVDYVPDYNSNDELDNIAATFKFKAPKTGTYSIHIFASAFKPCDVYTQEYEKISEAKSYGHQNIDLVENVETNVTYELDMKPFTDMSYREQVYISFDVWMINLQIEDVAWSSDKITEWPVQVSDSGVSTTNYSIYSNCGTEEPLYEITDLF